MRKPDLVGTGEAWLCPIPGDTRPDGEKHATIRHWLVKGPYHPFWNHWVVMVLHLRDLPGMEKAHKDSDEMTHEFMIMALNPGQPDKMKVYDADNLPYPIPYLRPLDCVVQFTCDSDAKAVDICDMAVKAIMAGQGSPDADFHSYWKQVIPATAACDKHAETKLQ